MGVDMTFDQAQVGHWVNYTTGTGSIYTKRIKRKDDRFLYVDGSPPFSRYVIDLARTASVSVGSYYSPQ